MKDFNKYISETEKISLLNDYITEATKSSTAINKMKQEFEDNWGENVLIANHKFKFYMSYYVYVYDIESIDELRKVDDIIKKYIPKYNGMDDDKLKEKFEEIKKLLKDRESKPEGIKHFELPCIFIGFTNKDIEK